jgi:hypothetical protein
VQLDELTDSWRRWYAVAAEETQGNGEPHSVLDLLGEAVRVEARKVQRAMGHLRDAVAGELEQARARY